MFKWISLLTDECRGFELYGTYPQLSLRAYDHKNLKPEKDLFTRRSSLEADKQTVIDLT